MGMSYDIFWKYQFTMNGTVMYTGTMKHYQHVSGRSSFHHFTVLAELSEQWVKMKC